MENDVLSSILSDGTTDNDAYNETEFDHSFDLTEVDLEPEEDTNETNTVNSANTETESETTQVESPTNTAFAQMRTQNKEFQNKMNEIESLVKGLGMKDVDDFIAKAKDAQIKKEAASSGIPVEVARELEEMRALKNSIVAEREENAAKQKERTFVSNLQDFVNKNELSQAAVDKLSQDLENDGLNVQTLMDMPKNTLNRILSSYVDTKYQKSLERKDAIRKELPINQSSKTDFDSLNKEIDTLAKQLAGKI